MNAKNADKYAFFMVSYLIKNNKAYNFFCRDTPYKAPYIKNIKKMPGHDSKI